MRSRFDDDQVGRKVDTECQGGRRDQDSKKSGPKKIFNQVSVIRCETCIKIRSLTI